MEATAIDSTQLSCCKALRMASNPAAPWPGWLLIQPQVEEPAGLWGWVSQGLPGKVCCSEHMPNKVPGRLESPVFVSGTSVCKAPFPHVLEPPQIKSVVTGHVVSWAARSEVWFRALASQCLFPHRASQKESFGGCCFLGGQCLAIDCGSEEQGTPKTSKLRPGDFVTWEYLPICCWIQISDLFFLFHP